MLAQISINVYNSFHRNNRKVEVKQSEFRRYLKSLGATFKQGTRHEKVYLNGKRSMLGRHPNEELKEGTRHKILKDLGLK